MSVPLAKLGALLEDFDPTLAERLRGCTHVTNAEEAGLILLVNAAPHLIAVAKAAKRLDEALAAKHSGFDSDGIYERYIYAHEERPLTDALAALRAALGEAEA